MPENLGVSIEIFPNLEFYNLGSMNIEMKMDTIGTRNPRDGELLKKDTRVRQ